MTNEQKQRYRETRKNMTDEERQKYKEYQKNYRKKLSNKIIQHDDDDNYIKV